METRLDCISCFVRQALDAARMTTNDQLAHERIMKELMGWLSSFDLATPPPVMGQRIHRLLRELSGNPDPYREQKRQQNRMALSLIPQARRILESADDRLLTAAKFAIVGNVIDLGIGTSVNERELHETIVHILDQELTGDFGEFARTVSQARKILYIADNAGEIVFDRLLVEQLAPRQITLAVRGGPIINDATADDAIEAGFDGIAEVIDNGSDAPGTILEECNLRFRDEFASSDLVIAKGQGNYETLSDTQAPIFFLFKAKCQVIADHVGQARGTHILMRSKAYGTFGKGVE